MCLIIIAIIDDILAENVFGNLVLWSGMIFDL